MRKKLAGKIVRVDPYISEQWQGVTGSAAPANLETLLQLTHLIFTAPRRDETAFAAWQARESEQARNRRLSPEQSFSEDLYVLMSQNHPRRQPVTKEALQKVRLETALTSYRQRFADAGNFTFVFVGNVQPERLLPLCQTYLGSLPGPVDKGPRAIWESTGPRALSKRPSPAGVSQRACCACISMVRRSGPTKRGTTC